MKKRLSRKSLLIAVLTTSLVEWNSPATAKRQAHTVIASVGWSEWCPPGFVLIDLDDGAFQWFAQMPRPECQNTSSRPFLEGKIALDQLDTLREAVAEADRTGLILPECIEGKASPHPVVSNAGPPYMLVVSSPTSSKSAPTELGCWSRPAVRLQRSLEKIFNLRVRPVGK